MISFDCTMIFLRLKYYDISINIERCAIKLNRNYYACIVMNDIIIPYNRNFIIY